MTKVVQRLQKVSQTRPNGFKTPQKGSQKTKWLAFLKKFDVFSTISSFPVVLPSIWLLFALIGSCWLLLAPIALHLLLLPPIVSYCLLAALIVSYWLLMAPLGSYWLLLLILSPIGSYWFPFAPIVSYCLLRAPLAPVVSCWLLLPLLRSYWFPLAPPCTFQKKNALPVHLLRQVTGSAGTAMDVLVTCFSKMGGGSGRRGCKGGARSVISVHYTDLVFNLRFFCSSFSPNVSKT